MFFNKNKPFFLEYNQWLIEEMEKESFESRGIEVLHINDDIVFKVADEEGNEFYTGSVYDPKYEAEQFLDGVNFDNTGYILIGITSSAIVKKILKEKTETSWLLIIEKDLKLVKRFLDEVDLSSYLDGKMQRIIILSGEMGDYSAVINTYINSLIGYYLFQTDILRTYASYRRDAKFYDEIIQTLINHIRTHMTSIGNSIEDTLMGITNELKNVPIVLKSQSLSKLKDKYKDKPIICVSSGPSLDKQLPLLREAKGKAVIICAESAFRVLMKNGIVPDIVGILERGPNSYELSIKGQEIPEETALMGLTLMDPRIPRAWNQYVVPIFKQNITHSRLLNKSLGDLGTLYNGNSVAHLNYSIAHFLGGSPIVFIGQDLAYSTEGQTHSKDSFYIDQSDIELSEQQRNQLRSSLEEDKTFFNRTVFLDGYYGEKVKSRELWRQFLHWMEHLITVLPSKVINATEGGVDIAGTIKKPFSEVVETYCQESIPSIPEIFTELSALPIEEEIQSKLKGMIELLNKQLGEMDQVALFAAEIYLSAKTLQEEINSNTMDLLELKVSRIMRNVEKLLKQILSDTFLTFFYRPLLSNYHVKMNPISRISSIERLQLILKHQSYFLSRIMIETKKVIKVYKDGVKYAVNELGFDSELLYVDLLHNWDLPEDDDKEEEHE
ncbi:MAG TPA: 6-hydroxymethylpterin diphosphokinase MptE-like protein [Candidatus Bathyarchaeia archaeon]|nr:6-hydroxymethylpterin diphosphokinase MptE-like protein [Candidatus Bathyarchaeia archaeon]